MSVPTVRDRRSASSAALVRPIALLAALLAAPLAQADIALTAAASPTTYTRGQINSYVIDLRLISDAYAGADTTIFRVPEGVTLSAIRERNTFTWCSDVDVLVLGMGTREGGWYQRGYPQPAGCGSLSGSPAPGELQVVIVDLDVPADYAGDLPLEIHLIGDGNGEPPNEASVTLNLADDGSAAQAWHFDALSAPALPAGWIASASGAATPWVTQAEVADTSPNGVHTPAPDAAGEAILTSASIAVPAGGGEVQFRQRLATEAGADGGVLEIAIDGGAFADVIAAGGHFTTGGYTGALAAAAACGGSAHPLAGRMAWSGTQAAFTPVAVALPMAAAGRSVQLRWRLATDCAETVDGAGGWWIDDVRISDTTPRVAVPVRLAVSIGAGTTHSETLDVGNTGGGLLGYVVTAADDDCAAPGGPSWLQLGQATGQIAGGARDAVALTIDASGLAAGDYTAQLCVAGNDTDALRAVALRLHVGAEPCIAADRLFANGFDDASDGVCAGALRTFDDAEAFLAAVAPGADRNTFTGLRSGYVHGPLAFGDGRFTYQVTGSPPGFFGNLVLFAGAGMLAPMGPGPDSRLTIDFTGAPVTALGGHFWGQLFFVSTSLDENLQLPTPIVLTLDDGTVETFTATSQRDFRGFVATRPIRRLTIAAPLALPDGDYAWGVFDNLIVGRAR